MLERELEWAHLTIEKRDAQIRLLEERLRQRRIQLLGPHSETLSDLQLELLAEEEPSATREEVEAEARREPLPPKPPRGTQTASGPAAVAGESAAHRAGDSVRGANCKTCGAETSIIGYDESEVLDRGAGALVRAGDQARKTRVREVRHRSRCRSWSRASWKRVWPATRW